MIFAWKNINFHVLKFCKLTSLTSFVLFAFRRQKLDEIKRRKLQELREAGVPDKYCNEVARRIEAPPPSLSRMYWKDLKYFTNSKSENVSLRKIYNDFKGLHIALSFKDVRFLWELSLVCMQGTGDLILFDSEQVHYYLAWSLISYDVNIFIFKKLYSLHMYKEYSIRRIKWRVW